MLARCLLTLLLLLPLSAHSQEAASPTPEIPEALRPWVGWVLHGHEQERCPLVDGSDRRQCIWPSRLQLDVGPTGGRFSQEWHVDAPGWVPLPGDARTWPQDVRADGQDAVVIKRMMQPHTYLASGRHVVSGTFHWDGMPPALPVPNETGLLALTVNGEAQDFPDRDEGGRVWLQRRGGEPEEQNRADVSVHRRILDSIPLQVTTRISLEVAGHSREEVLGRPLLEGFVPMALQSVLPVRLEPDGRLRVQVRPGRWTIEVVGRHQGPVDALRFDDPDGPWDTQEVWAFEARNDLRVVAVEGVPPIDAQQTELPADWRQLPAYALNVGDGLRFVETQRGDADPAPDRLTLRRTWWLDFDGDGYTVRDQLNATMNRGWRLSMRAPARLGRVAIAGQDRLITESADGSAGVEVRERNVNLEADSRIEGGVRTVEAVAWDHDVQELSGALNLGPGWRLLHASGVDRASPTWVSTWTLFDLFVVLLVAMAFARLWGWLWGVVALLALGLTYIEPGAPRALWVAVLIAAALVRVLPSGRWAQGARVLSVVTFLALLLNTVPFMVQQARQAVYPALSFPAAIGWSEPFLSRLNDVAEQRPRQEESAVAMRSKEMAPAPPMLRQAFEKYAYEVDPSATVQTGPGVPGWRWRTVSLQWSGPVDASQQLRLTLVPPWLNRLIEALRVLLLAALLVCVARRLRGVALGNAAVALGGLALLLMAPPAQAELPGGDLLQQLRQRLLENPTCAPTCAAIPEMYLEADAGSLRLRLRVDAAAEVSVPLPGRTNQWTPETVLLDGSAAPALMRSGGLAWIRLDPGRHDIVLEGRLPGRAEVQIHLALLPHRVRATVAGWTVDGIHEDGIADSDIVLVRVRGADEVASGVLEPNALPPFVHVSRVLRLGLTWEVRTSIVRATPPGVATVLEIPLLPGEAVTTAGVRVVDGKATVNLGAAEMQREWRSILPQTDELKLVAGDAPSWAELWYLDINPIWHVEAAGIPMVHEAMPEGNRLRSWKPWPGESVDLTITRPAPLPGRSITFDSSEVRISPGLRSTDVHVSLSIRSARGGEHALTLPEGADLQSVSINESEQPIRQDGRKVTVPLTPGMQEVKVFWRQAEGVSTRFVSPEIDLGAPSVNATVVVAMPEHRWTLFTRGPRLGPAVLFWGLLVIFLGVSVALGSLRMTPLAWYHWFLLSLGLTQVPVVVAAIVVGWLFLLGWRREHGAARSVSFNVLQLLIALTTPVALAALLFSIQRGLLGLPEMQIAGNGSSAYQLRWFEDISGQVLPQVSVFSVPLFVYRLAMLLWALWLARALLGWLRWGWESFASRGLWWSGRPVEVAPTTESRT